MSTAKSPTAKIDFIDHHGSIDDSVNACPECASDWFMAHGIGLHRDEIRSLLVREIPIVAEVEQSPHTKEIHIHPIPRSACEKCGSV